MFWDVVVGSFETCNGRIVELARLIKMDLDKKCAILVILQFLVQNSFTADSLSKFRNNFNSNTYYLKNLFIRGLAVKFQHKLKGSIGAHGHDKGLSEVEV